MGFRVFHWIMVSLFGLAYLSGEDAGLAHAWLGYGCLLLLGWRLWAALRHTKGFPGGVRLARLRSSGQCSRSVSLLLLSVIVLVVLGGVLMVDNAAVIRHGLQYLLPASWAVVLAAPFAALPIVDLADLHAGLAWLSLWLVGLHLALMLLLRRSALAFMLGLSGRRPTRSGPPCPAPSRQLPPAADAVLQVSLQGERHRLRLPAGQRVLDAMEQQGLRPPCHCRAGMCGACRCKVAQGKVVMHNNLVLSQEEIDAGWVLACQAVADAPLLDIRFEPAADIFDSPP